MPDGPTCFVQLLKSDIAPSGTILRGRIYTPVRGHKFFIPDASENFGQINLSEFYVWGMTLAGPCWRTLSPLEVLALEAA